MMKKKNSLASAQFLYFIAVVFLMQACESSSRVSSRNLTNLYSRQAFDPAVEFKINHGAGDSSDVHFNISRSNLLYIKKPDGQSEAITQIAWKLYSGYDSRHLLDSASFIINDIWEAGIGQNIRGNFKIKVPKDRLLLYEVRLTDLNRQSENYYLIETIRDSTCKSRDCYSVWVQDDLLMHNYVSMRDTFKIVHADFEGKFFVRYYEGNFPLPTPPFSTDRLKPFEYFADSLFIIDNSSDTDLCFPKQGFYHFQRDSTEKSGYTLFRFSDDYPLMTDALSLLHPIRYLSTRKEHESILMSKDKKAALDDYWLNLGGSQERARELIKHFYSRVQDSNRYFTCHTEGWRTDRGLIYIVFGKPNSVYRNAYGETWIYGSGSNSLSVSFNFERIKNPFSNNDYMLQRSPSYEMTWYTAVETWRQGRAFNQK